MSEKRHEAQLGDRARIPPDELEEPMTDDQREAFIDALDAKNMAQAGDVVIQHKHRDRESTGLNVTITRYELDGASVECKRVGDMRMLKIVTRESFEPGVDIITERYPEARPEFPDDDYYDEISRYVDPVTGKSVREPPKMILTPVNAADEQIVLQAKLDEHTLTQGRWQSAMDYLDSCTPEYRVSAA